MIFVKEKELKKKESKKLAGALWTAKFRVFICNIDSQMLILYMHQVGSLLKLTLPPVTASSLP